jgi:threonyl-tRNA synthetase
VTAALKAAGLKVIMDNAANKINYKVREHSEGKIPVIICLGAREAAERTVAIRRLGSDKQEFISLDDAISALVKEATMP